MIAWINSFIGFSSAFLIGEFILKMQLSSLFTCLGAAQVAGLVALITTLRLEANVWVREHLLTRPMKTWTIFLSLYFGIMFSLAEPLRNLRNFAWLFIPIVFSNGLTILLFGPIQDHHYRRSQLRVES